MKKWMDENCFKNTEIHYLHTERSTTTVVKVLPNFCSKLLHSCYIPDCINNLMKYFGYNIYKILMIYIITSKNSLLDENNVI